MAERRPDVTPSPYFTTLRFEPWFRRATFVRFEYMVLGMKCGEVTCAEASVTMGEQTRIKFWSVKFVSSILLSLIQF